MSRLFFLEEVKNILCCEVLGSLDGDVVSVAIDSREAGRNALFIPLKGEVTDGNLFIEGALKNGCLFSLVSEAFYIENSKTIKSFVKEYGCTFFIVADGLKALQRLAAGYISQFKDLKVISITGSSGKTTTKEVLGSICRAYTETLVTDGNYNSETGLPLTVFRINAGHKLAVLEMGMSKPGEIKALVDIINPEVSVITNIGTAHIGFFESRDGIAKEKKDAFANFTGSNLAIIPGWDDYNEFLQEGVHGRVVSVSDSPSYISGVKNLGFDGWEFLYEGIKVSYPYMGRYNFLNALMAIACVRELGFPSSVIVEGLAGLPSLFGRGEVLSGKSRLIRDCYNANPESTLSSLELLKNTQWDDDKIPILGSMLELGVCSFDEHLRVVQYALEMFSTVIFFGNEYGDVLKTLDKGTGILFFNDMDELKNYVGNGVKPGSLVLLKASRGVKLEEITDSILF